MTHKPFALRHARRNALAVGLVAVAAAGAGGCDGRGRSMETAGPTEKQPIVSAFVCDGGLPGRVVWRGDTAEVSFGGETWVLPQAISGSGARYFDGKRELWEHQGALRLTIEAAAPLQCSFVKTP